MMDWLRKFTDEASNMVLSEVSRFKNRTFLESTVAGCALVAAANGTIASEEKQKMMGFLRTSRELSVFSTNDVVRLFNEHAERFAFDFQVGQADAIKVVSRIKGNPEAARVMVRVCCLIGASDGNFDDDEKKAVVNICKALDLSPSEFQL